MNTQAPSTTIFATPHLRIGRFRCPPWHPDFHDTGPIVSGHLIVFPRTSVCIRHPGRPPIVADPNTIMFYNLHQCYQRDCLSAEGDRCEWFAFAPEILINALQPYIPQVVDQPQRPFGFTHVRSTPQLYLRQRQVIEHLAQAGQPDQLYVEESMLLTLAMLVDQIYKTERPVRAQHRRQTHQQQQAIAYAVQETLAIRFQEKILLDQLAAAVYLSPYELCRVFRTHTGCSIHQYLNQLRLCTALETVTDAATNLTELALTLGYNSHSHFTSAFHKTFGVTPSMLRATAKQQQNLRKNLIA